MIVLNVAILPYEQEATYINNLLLQNSLSDVGDQNLAARKITNGTRMIEITLK